MSASVQWKRTDSCLRFPAQMPAPWGIRGISIAQQLRPLQVFINQSMTDYQDALSTMSRGKWLVPRGAEIEAGHIDDQIGTQILYSGTLKPEAWTPNSLPPDGVQFVWQIWEKADETVGTLVAALERYRPKQPESRRGDSEGQRRAGRAIPGELAPLRSGIMAAVDLAIDKARVIAKHNRKYATRYGMAPQWRWSRSRTSTCNATSTP